MASPGPPPSIPKSHQKKIVRVLMNGCFDLLHAGHYNALRQSKFIDVEPDERVVLVAGVSLRCCSSALPSTCIFVLFRARWRAILSTLLIRADSNICVAAGA